MQIRRFNRVELALPGEDIPEAARVLDEVLGGHLTPPHVVPDQGIISAVDFRLGIELFGPDGASSPRRGMFDRRPRRGSIGPIVWEVDDYDAARAEAVAQGFRIAFEFGAPGVRQLHLDAEQLFGFGVTFTERSSAGIGEPPTAVDRFEKLELLVAQDEIHGAVDVFNGLLGAQFAAPTHLRDQDVLTTTDFTMGIELLAPASPASPVARSLERKGRGAIGPIVWEVGDLDAAKVRLASLGYRVVFEYRAPGRHQVHLDPDQLYGYGVTLSAGRHPA